MKSATKTCKIKHIFFVCATEKLSVARNRIKYTCMFIYLVFD